MAVSELSTDYDDLVRPQCRPPAAPARSTEMELLLFIVIVIAVIGYIGYVLNSRSSQEAGAKMQQTAAKGWGCLGCGLKGCGLYIAS